MENNCNFDIISSLSNGKINLFLIIKNYCPKLKLHDIESLMIPEFIICDFIKIKIWNQIYDSDTVLSVEGDPKINNINNTILKIISFVREQFGIKNRIHCYVYKYIKIGSGLGGGSSNAMIVFKLLKDYFKFELNSYIIDKACRWIGSDCLFFNLNKKSLVSDYGFKCVPVTNSKIIKFKLIFNSEICLSKNIFSIYKLEKKNSFYKKYNNDLLSSAFVSYDTLKIKFIIYRLIFNYQIIMSGSGSTFVLFKNKGY